MNNLGETVKQHMIEKPFDLNCYVQRVVTFIYASLGAALIVGGSQRMPSPTYAPLLALSQGDAWPWGIVILAAAGLLLMPNCWLNMIGVGIGILWTNLFAVMFFIAIVKFQTAGSTAPFAYEGISLVSVGLLAAQILEYRRSQ